MHGLMGLLFLLRVPCWLPWNPFMLPLPWKTLGISCLPVPSMLGWIYPAFLYPLPESATNQTPCQPPTQSQLPEGLAFQDASIFLSGVDGDLHKGFRTLQHKNTS